MDFAQPVAVLLVAVLHFVPNSAGPAEIVATLRDALAPGSYVVICHSCRDANPGMADPATAAYRSRVTRPSSASAAGRRSRPCSTGSTWSSPGWSGCRNGARTPADVPENPEEYWASLGVGRRLALR